MKPFWATKSRGAHAIPEISIVPVACDCSQDGLIDTDEQHGHGAKAIGSLLRKWATFGAFQRRIVDSVRGELLDSSHEIEVETSGVITAFKAIAGKANAQTHRIANLAMIANSISVDGRDIELKDVAATFDKALSDILAKFGSINSQALSMVEVLGSMEKRLEQVEACIAQVEAINRQASMLSINARIEAHRAGESGKAFSVVASEIREFSKSTQSVAHTMRGEMGMVIGAIRDSHKTLDLVAKLDMTENFLMKNILDRLVRGMVDRNETMGRIVTSAALDSQTISKQLGQIVTGMQFQDRINQRMEQISDTLSILGDATEQLVEESSTAVPAQASGELPGESDWLRELSSRYRLSDMRARFVAEVIDGRELTQERAAHAREKPADAGSIELF